MSSVVDGWRRWRRDSRAHLVLALPLCIGQLGQQLMALVDTAFLGRYSDAALAGAGVGNSLLFTLAVIGMGAVMGLDTLVPQALGAGAPERARALFRGGVRLAVIVGVPLTGLAAISPGLLDLFGVDAAVAAEGRRYVYGRLPAIVPMLVFTAQRSYLQALGVTRPLVVAMVVANLANVAADSIFIFGDRTLEILGLPALGLPAFGALGAAWSTSVVSVLAAVVGGVAVRAVSSDGAASGRGHTRQIAWVGAPVSGHLLAEVGIFALTGILAGRLGELPAAAHMVALTIASFSFATAMGMASATSVRVGHAIGAGEPHEARRAGFVGMSLGAVVMGAAGLVFLIAPGPLASLFTDEAPVIAATMPLLRIAALFQLSDAVQAIAAGALRGVGDNRSTFLGNLLGHYGIGLWIAIWLAFGRGHGASGLWWGLSVGLTAVAIGLSLRFARVTRGPVV